jgi:hypothetical protein
MKIEEAGDPHGGEKKGQNTVTDQNHEILKAHLVAVTKLLLNKAQMKAGVSITAGGPLDELQKLDLCRIAKQSGNDVIHLELATNDALRFGLVGICVVVPRDQICYMFSDCRLYLGQRKSKAVILPRPEARGHFRMGPGELIHVDGKPDDAEEGARRAHERLRSLIERAPCMQRQVRIEEIPG